MRDFLQGLRHALNLFDVHQKRKLLILFIFQCTLNLLEILGLLLVGIVASLSISGIKKEDTSGMSLINWLTDAFGTFTIQSKTLIISTFLALMIISKNILGYFLHAYIIKCINDWSVSIAENQIKKIFLTNFMVKHNQESMKIIYQLTGGINSVAVGLLGSSLIFLADLIFIFIVILTILIMNPGSALLIVMFCIITILVLYLFIRNKAQIYATESTTLSIESGRKTFDAINLSKEIYISNRGDYVINSLLSTWRKLARSNVKLGVLPFLTKYIVESFLLLFIVLILSTQFLTQSSNEAFISSSILFVALFRIAPAILRIQNSVSVIQSSLGSSKTTFEMIATVNHEMRLRQNKLSNFDPRAEDIFLPRIEFHRVKFNHEKETKTVLEDVSFCIEPLDRVALIGDSGAGKSTLIELILGIKEPSAGDILLSNTTPLVAMERYKGNIAYVPQDIHIFGESIFLNIYMRENLIGQSGDFASLLRIVDFEEIGQELNYYGVALGKGGKQISGGQKQKIGIARALSLKPKLLIMDESTSSIDLESERRILNALFHHLPDTTLVFATHRFENLDLFTKQVTIKNSKVSVI